MAQRVTNSKSDLLEVLLETYTANAAMNQLLLANLDPRAWRASPANEDRREERTLADIFAHLHNNRLVWIKRSAPHFKCPPPLDPARCTIKQGCSAHRQSALRCLQMLKDVLSDSHALRIKKFSRGSWAPTWPAGATMFTYMFAHDAHHRGQIIMLARQLGYRLPDKAVYGIWRWDRRQFRCIVNSRHDDAQQHGRGPLQLHVWLFKLERDRSLRFRASLVDDLDATKIVRAACVRRENP